AGSRTGGRLGRRAPRPGPAPIGPVRALAAGDGLPVATGARARSAGGGGRRDRGRRIVGARVREGEPPLPTADRRAEDRRERLGPGPRAVGQESERGEGDDGRRTAEGA